MGAETWSRPGKFLRLSLRTGIWLTAPWRDAQRKKGEPAAHDLPNGRQSSGFAPRPGKQPRPQGKKSMVHALKVAVTAR